MNAPKFELYTPGNRMRVGVDTPYYLKPTESPIQLVNTVSGHSFFILLFALFYPSSPSD